MFYSDKFEWNGISSDELGLCLVTFGDELLNDNGFEYLEPLTAESVFNDTPCYFKGKKEIEEIVLNFCLVDSNYIPLEWEDYKLEEIYSIFITNDFKPFISYDNLDNIYYLKATKIKKVMTHKRRGHLEITFQPYTSYAYKKYKRTINVTDTVDTTVVNYSNLEEKYRPVLEIENLGEENSTVSVQNLSIQGSEAFILKDLKAQEKLIVDGLYYTVLNSEGENRFSTCNRKWVELKKGANKIRLTGNFNITIKAEYPIIT